MIAVRMTRLALALLLAAAPVAVSAQAVTDIAIGQTLTKKAGTKVDLYRFVGGSGTTIKATLTAPGKNALILYTPAGEEMLTVRRSGSVTLEAILPLWDVFYLGVIREKTAAPYSLELAGLEATAAQALFAYKVGYLEERGGIAKESCWIEPGVKKRATWESTVAVSEFNPDGRTLTRFYALDGKPKNPFSMTLDAEWADDSIKVIADGGKETTTSLKDLIGVRPQSYLGTICDNQFGDWM